LKNRRISRTTLRLRLARLNPADPSLGTDPVRISRGTRTAIANLTTIPNRTTPNPMIPRRRLLPSTETLPAGNTSLFPATLPSPSRVIVIVRTVEVPTPDMAEIDTTRESLFQVRRATLR